MMLFGVTAARQILEIQKTLARNGFRNLALLQERGDQLAQTILANSERSADTRQLWEGWSETSQTGRRALETATDAYFEMLTGTLPRSSHDR